MGFNETVLYLTEQIPRGRVTSYGELARAIGDIGLSRAVGQVLNKNKKPVEIPCHRLVRSDGCIGGYSRGVPEKIKLLHLEGVTVEDNRVQDFREIFYRLSEMKSP